ncbi:hypothetical protein [Alloyangia pacifica]|uniref:hypothetical protein n=1 Tax=Alloyangia pacifica TaxID=311180 RepID=UPI001CD53A17|nr:hypothetical protein [Alloyangia pacifica]MCA0996121.1 hypothetical protein [Alloyangia pacifica]
MLRNFTLGLIGAAMIALPAGIASAQGKDCNAGGSKATCSAPANGHGAQAQKGQQQGAQQGKQQQAKAPAQQASPTAKQASAKSSAPQSSAPMARGAHFDGGEKISDPKAHGLSQERGVSYYKKDGQLYRVDDDTREILAVVGAVAELLN